MYPSYQCIVLHETPMQLKSDGTRKGALMLLKYKGVDFSIDRQNILQAEAEEHVAQW
jgi:hypothetical protein